MSKGKYSQTIRRDWENQKNQKNTDCVREKFTLVMKYCGAIYRYSDCE